MKANSPAFALHCMQQGFVYLQRPELRRYLWIPLAINLVLYSVAFVAGYAAMNHWLPLLIPDWLTWLSWVLWPLFFVSFMLMSFFTFTLLANLIASPWYSALSNHALSLINGQSYTPVELVWHKAIFGELKRLGYLALRLLPLIVLSVIPVINSVAPILWALFGAWALAMEFVSYPAENRGLGFQQQKQLVQSNRLGMLSLGFMVNLGLMIPVVNLVIGQTAVIAATLMLKQLVETQTALPSQDA